MSSMVDIPHNEFSNLHEILAFQDAEIFELQEKSSLYDEEIAIKNDLQKRSDEFQHWIKEAKINLKQSNAEHQHIIDGQLKILKKSDLTETSLRADHHRLSDVNKSLSDQLQTLQRAKERLITDIQKLEKFKNDLKNKFDDKTIQLSEKSCAEEKLAKNFKNKQNEIHDTRKQLEEFRSEVRWLKDRCENLKTDATSSREKLGECQTKGYRLEEQFRDLETDLESARKKLEHAEIRSVASEARLKTETDTLVEKLDCRAWRLQEVETERDEATRYAADQQCKVNRLEALAVELQATCERQRCEATEREQLLKREASQRCEDICQLGEQLVAARADHSKAASEVASHKARALAYENVMESVRQSADARDMVHEEVRERLERDNAELSRKVQQKTAAIAELERQESRLRDEINRCADAAEQCCDSRLPVDVSLVSTDDSFIHRMKRLFCNK